MTTGQHVALSSTLAGVVGGVASAFTTGANAAVLGFLVFCAYWGVIFVGDLD